VPRSSRERLQALLAGYDSGAPLERASTLPSGCYLDPSLAELERRTVFATSWQHVGRSELVSEPGQYLTAEVAGEPVAVVRGADGVLRGFFNVCRHHAAAVLTQPCGHAPVLRCPYHGWTYALDGTLRGTPDFDGAKDFERGGNGLAPLAVEEWQGFVFVRLAAGGPSLREFTGELAPRVEALRLSSLRFFERRSYELGCNWKVYVDNYLDGSYHVPHLHKGLNSVLDYSRYTIETGARFVVQSGPLVATAENRAVSDVRAGERASYLWLYPNFMLNVYAGVMDTNLVLPLGPDRTRVVFDFYFDDVSEATAARNRASVAFGERVQDEDVAICESVQRGLASRAYDVGRLSPRREAGEQLFHRLLVADVQAGLLA
jgi:phenylpropionate dioxygenase-like ring-hydroxylating dioxygenase large terminal subunit